VLETVHFWGKSRTLIEGDLKAGVTHTASLLGLRAAHLLMMTLFCVGVVSATTTVFVVRLIPG
jgi:4-hydroxybenzoate polyprenyltransferase